MPLPERQVIERIRRMAARGARKDPGRIRILRSIGEDCAVLRLGATQDLLVTTDFSIEGVHFRRDWHPAESAGHRCLARGLSDIASMGGEPMAAFLSLGLPARLPEAWVDEFLKGFLQLAKPFGVTLAGGDVAHSPERVVADVVVVGGVPRGSALLRSGARAGDYVYVTGEPGRSAATLELLQKGKRVKVAGVHRQHFFPEPRVEAGLWLRKHGAASAMIDLSDGISTDLEHICDESGLAAEIWAGALTGQHRGQSLELALHGGEDYELLFTAAPGKKIPAKVGGVRVRRIGKMLARRRSAFKMTLVGSEGRQELKPGGYEHFRSSKER